MLSSHCSIAKWNELCSILLQLDTMRMTNPLMFWIIVISVGMTVLGMLGSLTNPQSK